MKQVTISVDKDKYENLDEWERKTTGRTAKEDILTALRLYMDIENEPRPPSLRIAGKPEKRQKQETRSAPNNVTRIGGPARPPERKLIKLNVDDSLHDKLAAESRKQNLRIRELTEKWANEHIDVCNPEMSETTRNMLAYIGIPLMELLKQKKEEKKERKNRI
jgi:hypothetical protein